MARHGVSIEKQGGVIWKEVTAKKGEPVEVMLTE